LSNFAKLVSAGRLIFVSAWVRMIFAGIVQKDAGIRPFGYVTSHVATSVRLGNHLALRLALGIANQQMRYRVAEPNRRLVSS